MQFHLEGFEPGDPDIHDRAERLRAGGAAGSPPADVDVLIVGCGPAGLALAAQLSKFPDIRTCIVEQKPERLLRGQADGIACRTMEMFHAMGFSERVLRESYWVNETTFWKPDETRPDAIMRSGRVQDVEDGLSEFPHVILNQARVHDFFLDVMRRSPGRIEPYYARRVMDVAVDPAAPADAPGVTVQLERLDAGFEGMVETVRARAVVGCDGARSTVRKAIGRALHGDSANQVWGVMDVLAVTEFPDIRLKSIIKAPDGGSIVLIPREGGYLVRVYVEIDSLGAHERAASRNITIEQLVAAAQRIFRPYRFEVKDVAWWSVYEIGQRVCDKFDDVPEQETGRRAPRVFIAGDACHTHSPKAGQGMNVSMQDAFNLGWKLAAVLRGQCRPDLLHSYSAERQAIARELIDFDREWASLLSAAAKGVPGPDGRPVDATDVQRYFVQHGRYTAGTATRYRPSLLVGPDTHQHLAAGFVIGTRFHSAPVIRLADAKPFHLGHAGTADGRWRLYAFADARNPAAPDSLLRAFCRYLAEDAASPVRRFTRPGDDIDSVFDVRAIFQQGHRDVALEAMPDLLLPPKGRLGLRDYEKMFCPDLKEGPDVFDMRGIDRTQGCVVVVRPDQYVAHVLPLDGYGELGAFFEKFLMK